MDEAERARRLKVADAIEDHRRGLVTRRQMLGALAQLGFCSLAGLAGCRRRAAPAPPAAGPRANLGPHSALDPESEQHRFLRDVGRAFAGTRLLFIQGASRA